MKVIVYVEGPSDVAGLSVLFAGLIRAREDSGVAISFLEPTEKVHRKESLLLHQPKKAVNILHNVPNSRVAIVPDLYPANKGFPHTTADEMVAGIRDQFDKDLQRKGIDDRRLQDRLGVFCFKYEFEVLLLAAKEQLRAYLKCPEFACRWQLPPEDQNHNNSPKDVVKQLFRECGRKYDWRLDIPGILYGVDYRTLKQVCPQCFAPFAEWLESAG